MKRLALAVLLSLPGLAAAQEAPGDLAPIFSNSSSRVFLISDLGRINGVEASPERAVVPLAADADIVADGEVLLLFVEDDGVRMPEPDEQFSLD
jgi:hypothetical protein